ncbi:MAG: hypothetical protein ACOY3I_10155 [Verrucomicrobiota bacterium]
MKTLIRCCCMCFLVCFYANLAMGGCTLEGQFKTGMVEGASAGLTGENLLNYAVEFAKKMCPGYTPQELQDFIASIRTVDGTDDPTRPKAYLPNPGHVTANEWSEVGPEP